MKKFELLIAYHKEFFNIDSNLFTPIHVGAQSSSKQLNIQRDDTGINISIKNNNYCELTAHYWSFKNVDAEYYGLMHYRRYFMSPRNILNKRRTNLKQFRKKLKSYLYKDYIFEKNDVYNIKSKKRILKEFTLLYDFLDSSLSTYDIILPKPHFFNVSIKKQYINSHEEEDLNRLESIIKKSTPQYYESYKNVMDGSKLYAFNMFIMQKKYYNDYMSWLFKVLFEVEKDIISTGNTVYPRLFGFLSERLLGVYLDNLIKYNKDIKILELPILFIEE